MVVLSTFRAQRSIVGVVFSCVEPELLREKTSWFALCQRRATEGRLVHTELRTCMKVEVAVLGSPSLTVPTVSVDVKQH